MAFEELRETPPRLARTFSDTSPDATGLSDAHAQSHDEVRQQTQPGPKRKRGRPKIRTEEESDIDMILLVGSKDDDKPDYRAMEDAPAELQFFGRLLRHQES